MEQMDFDRRMVSKSEMLLLETISRVNFLAAVIRNLFFRQLFFEQLSQIFSRKLTKFEIHFLLFTFKEDMYTP